MKIKEHCEGKRKYEKGERNMKDKKHYDEQQKRKVKIYKDKVWARN